MLVLMMFACAKTGEIKTPDYTSMISDSVWKEVCPDGFPEQTWIQLRADGTFAFAYPGEGGWEHDGNETWTLMGESLRVSWNDDYAVSTYTIPGKDAEILPGTTTKSCGDRIQLIADPDGPDAVAPQ